MKNEKMVKSMSAAKINILKNQNTRILEEEKLYYVTNFQIILRRGKRYMIIISVEMEVCINRTVKNALTIFKPI